ncbi:MAG: alanine racemase [Gemmatimonadota bacterium]
MDPQMSHSGTPTFSRRRFLGLAGGAFGLAAAGCAATPSTTSPTPVPAPAARRSQFPDSYDPWIEIDREAFRHNVREASRLADARPILAVVKNNAYGLGDQAVGPVLADCTEVGGIACVRVQEALAMREAGVTKPILNMAEVSEEEMEVLVRNGIVPSVWLDDAPGRLDRLSRRLGHAVPVHLYLDTGMGREGMPYGRCRPWVEALCGRESVRVEGTYTMFVHELEFDREQFARFMEFLAWARGRGLGLGTLHAAPTFELFQFPESHLDMVRPGNALFGNYPSADGMQELADLKPVFRLCARVTRVERLEPGESAGFNRSYIAEDPTWIALLPIGHTDGYPSTASGTCEVLIGGRLYPVVARVSSAHTIVKIGSDKTVEVGDVATLIGPDDAAILPHTVADRTGVRFLSLITKLNARLPRRVV